MPQHSTTPWPFISLMAILMSFVALAIDAMLPALGQIGSDLNVNNVNDVQLVISSIFLGMALGLMFFGPFSDSFGRKPAIYIGMIIFALGCLISIFSSSFEVMIFGRILQGVGASSCRVVTVSIIRDQFEGNKMARIMSLIMIVFILVPALAPAIGQLILNLAGWRAIFVFMLFLAIVSSIWMALGLAESLPQDKRLVFSLETIGNGIVETFTHKVSRGYTIASGLIFGSFVGYLSSSQQILQIQYQLGELFSLYFAILALSIGMASFINSSLVERLGMVYLCKKALSLLLGLSILFLPYALLKDGHPPLFIFMPYMMLTFLCFGVLFGNFNTLAIEPLGHIAGVAGSVISSIQTFISVILGGLIGQLYNNTIIPLICGFMILSLVSLIIVQNTSKAKAPIV